MTSGGIIGWLRQQARGSQARLAQTVPEEPPPPPAPAIDAAATSYEEMLATALGERSTDYVGLTAVARVTGPLPVRLVAFYLPQFHPIPENDEWWGRGFTEWTNVSRAVPQFTGHYQPRLPGELGFYDLRVPDVLRRQVELARLHGLSAFCFHYYWFAGRRLLERPLQQFMDDGTIDFPFCVCWANENWTRRWDGRDDDVLMAQTYDDGTDAAFIADLTPVLGHRNYLRFEGRPVIVVYHARLLPDPAVTARRWRQHCVTAGIGNPYLVAAHVFEHVDPHAIGFDAAVEFPPNTAGRSMPPSVTPEVTLANPRYGGAVYRYADLAKPSREEPRPPYRLFRTVCPSWDNEARRPGRGSTYAFSTPALYRQWLEQACRDTLREPDPDNRLVFINAWNEWAEAAYLEPDRRFGYAYLHATREVIESLRAEMLDSVSLVDPVPAVLDPPSKVPGELEWQTTLRDAVAAFEACAGRAPIVLQWSGGVDIASVVPSLTVFSPPDSSAPLLPYIDASIDMVICAGAPTAIAEAVRVARGVVLAIGEAGPQLTWIAPYRQLPSR